MSGDDSRDREDEQETLFVELSDDLSEPDEDETELAEVDVSAPTVQLDPSMKDARSESAIARPSSLDRDQPADENQMTGRRLLGRYLFGEKLGAGGFGSVYRATDELKESGGEAAEIAIKIIHAEKIGQFMNALVQEVSRSHQVSHPNIVRVYDIHSDEGLAFITMELLEGQTLADRLTAAGLANEDRRNRLPVEETDRLAHDLCNALSHCHEQDIVHADIKPANIFVSSNGTVKLLDLGISQIKGSQGKLRGFSANYSSPQQMSGEPADPKDDLFAFGCVLFECLTGDRPFGGETSLAALRSEKPLQTSSLPRRYRRALARTLQLTRDKRTSTANQLWKSINPAVPRRNLAIAVAAAITLFAFIASNLVGQSTGKDAIAVSGESKKAAQAAYLRAIEIAQADPSKSRGELVAAVRANPYHEQAARVLAGIVEQAAFDYPQRYSMIWADFGTAFAAAPTSKSLQAVAQDRADFILEQDLQPLSRSELLSEYQAPVCVLVETGYRAEELERLRTEFSIRC
jgi:serine/threonine protein kinase